MADSGRRPELRVNQLGYLPAGPKCVVWVSDAVEPEAFRVRDGGGREVFGGWSVPWRQRPEPSSGLAVHVLDFSTTESEGGRFDVSGGWYDAGDFGKYVTSGAMPVWQLLGAIELLRRRRMRTAWWGQTWTGRLPGPMTGAPPFPRAFDAGPPTVARRHQRAPPRS